MLKEHLKAFFSYSKKELNGMLVFCILLVIVIFLPVVHQWLQPDEVFEFEAFKKDIAAFRAERLRQGTEIRVEEDVLDRTPEYFNFNPNKLSTEDWQRLGLSERQIKVIKNYELKGGRFYRKEDLKKIYSISAADYQRLERYIKIPERERAFTDSPPHPKFAPASVAREVKIVELNSADSALLVTLRGVGPVFASRIIKYRNRLGGFYNKEQLREVYGVDSVKYQELKDQVEVNELMVKKININTATFDDLKGHPYLRYNQINAIIQYRKQHGNYNNINDVKKISIINEENFRKIEPYLNL